MSLLASPISPKFGAAADPIAAAIASINALSPEIFTYAQSDTNIASWTDLSGNARHLTQATVEDQPALVTVGTDYALQFDKDDGTGGDQMLVPYDWLSGAAAATIFVGARKTTNVTERLLVFNNQDFDVRWISGTTLAVYVGGAANYLTIAGQSDNDPHVYEVAYDGSGATHGDRLQVSIDGGVKVGGQSGTIPATIPALTNGWLGAYGATFNNPIDGEVFLVLCFARVLDSAEKSAVYAALADLLDYATFPSATTDLTESAETLAVSGTVVDETATGTTLTAGATVVISDNGAPHVGFPTLYPVSAAPDIRCVYRLGTSHSDQGGQLVYRDSADDGATWGAETALLDTVGIDDRDPILSVVGGTLYVGWHKYTGTALQAYSRAFSGGAETNVSGYELWPGANRHTNRPTMYAASKWILNGGPFTANAADPRRVGLVNRDGGADTLHWLGSASFHLDESSIVDDGTAQIVVCRTQTLADATIEDQLVITRSTDGGSTWSDWKQFSVIGVAPHLLVHSSGTIYLAFKEQDGVARYTTMMWSSDHGATWGAPVRIYTHSTSDASYPSIVELSDNSLLVAHYEPRYIRATAVAIS